MNENSSPTYERNLELFARDQPLAARQLDTIDCSPMQFCFTQNGELNLVDEGPEGKRYLYAQEGAYKEAEMWAAIPPLQTTDALFVFGLGLGYYYFPLKQWLEEDKKRHLIFLEDDPRIIRCFLMTEWAEEILLNPQVVIQPLPQITPDEAGWETLRNAMGKLSLSFVLLRSTISCLQGYFLYRFPYFHPFSLQFMLNLSYGARLLAEFIHDPYKRFANYYMNIPYLGNTVPAETMKGALKGIPAILCGAGPSLDKHLHALSRLCDKAFIMAPSSSMNPLIGAAITPHVGGGIDPTLGQLNRLMARGGNDVPLLYHDFFNHHAFSEWHGPKLHLSKETAFGVSNWFEKGVGIPPDARMIAGMSTSNFLMEAAAFLGCHPILLVGMDLSLIDNERYSQGVSAHPSDARRVHAAIRRKDDALIPIPGYGGKDVLTNRHWLLESAHVSAFRLRHPEIDVVNCTEGGLTMVHVEDRPFGKAIGDYLNASWDIQGWFHGEICNATSKKHGEGPVKELIDEWRESLVRCKGHLERLIEALSANKRRERSKTPPRYGPYSGLAALWQVELHDEVVYRNFLESYDLVYDIIHVLERRAAAMTLDATSLKEHRYDDEGGRCRYLLGYVEEHLERLDQGMEEWNARKRCSGDMIEDALSADTILLEREGILYEANEGRLRIEDPELRVSLAAEFDPPVIPHDLWPAGEVKPAVEALIGWSNGEREGQTLYFYGDGAVKAEAYYHKGKLHGPWTYYGRDGNVLARSWFADGTRQGMSILYDSAGKVYSRQGYRDGLSEGTHLYFYPNGVLKSLKSYQSGMPHGQFFLYHPNGSVKWEQHYIAGELHGEERFYDSTGKVFSEACYDHGKPAGTSRRWHPNGQLEREVVHGGEANEIKEWDEQGREIKGN